VERALRGEVIGPRLSLQHLAPGQRHRQFDPAGLPAVGGGIGTSKNAADFNMTQLMP
jgi:hypothetical protein